jgi:hypothetical protein
MKVELAGAAILVLIVFGAPAFAQQDVPQKVEYRKWDLGTTVGMLVSGKRDFGRAGSYGSQPSGTLNLDAGRFLTTHLKVDTALLWTDPRSYYESIYSGPPTSQTAGYMVRDVRPTTVSGGLTYQFFENAFTHPYVTGGVRLTALREQRQTYSYPTTSAAPTIITTASQTSLQARPFGAFGFKSYFNERWFVRSELLLAFDRLGVSHGTARIGFGIDF